MDMELELDEDDMLSEFTVDFFLDNPIYIITTMRRVKMRPMPIFANNLLFILLGGVVPPDIFTIGATF